MGAYGSCDFFEIKGVCETILRELRVKDVRFEAEQNDPSYHPGRTAVVYSGETKLGIVGQIHPMVAKNYGLGETYTLQMDFNTILSCLADENKYKQLPRFPAITRDIAVVCDLAVTAGALSECIKKSGGKLLRDVKLFDVYTGNQVDSGKKSMAFSLTLRSDEQTLTDELADEAIKNVLTALETQLGAVIR